MRGTRSAAVVGFGDLLRRRIREALSSTCIVVINELAAVCDQSEQVGDATVIVVSVDSTATAVKLHLTSVFRKLVLGLSPDSVAIGPPKGPA